MKNEQKENFKYQIEEILDKTSIKELAVMISEICFEKAEHVATHWQDYDLASIWERNGKKFEQLSTKLEKTF